jgi:diguanylate cyclase (GGDEF)-like protein
VTQTRRPAYRFDVPDPAILIAAVSVLVAIALAAGVGVALYVDRREAASEQSSGADPRLLAPVSEVARGHADETALESPGPGLLSYVVRVVCLVFLASVGAVTALSDAWQTSEGTIYLLLAAATLFVVFVEDLVPGSRPGRRRYWVIAIASIGFVAILTGVTGGLYSWFVPGYFVIVAASAVSSRRSLPPVLALIAGSTYVAIGIAIPFRPFVTTDDFALMLLTLALLALIAFIASVLGGEVRRIREAALQLSRFDPLTGLYNRSYFQAALDREIRRSARTNRREFAILMLDLDGLKPVNDTRGHHVGDQLIRGVAAVLQRTVRSTDTPARFGGDEFALLLPETNQEGALAVAEKLRREAEGLDERGARTTVSIGLVLYPIDGDTVEQLLTQADDALYLAKKRGKNQVVGYENRREHVVTSNGAPHRSEPPAIASMESIEVPSSDAGAPRKTPVAIEIARATPPSDVGMLGPSAPWETRTVSPSDSL